MKIDSYKIPLLILIVTIAVSYIFVHTTTSSSETWNYQKSIYKELIDLVGNISSNTEDVSKLETLKKDFDKYYDGEMIFAEADDHELIKRMMILRKDYENHLLGLNDFYKTDKLKQSCRKLIKQLNTTISNGDTKSRTKLFLPLLAGLASLILYYLFSFFVKSKRKSKEQLPTETVDKIKHLIGNAKTEEALDILKEILEKKKSSKLDTLLLIRAQYYKTQEEKNLELIDFNQVRTSRAKINQAILDLLNMQSE